MISSEYSNKSEIWNIPLPSVASDGANSQRHKQLLFNPHYVFTYTGSKPRGLNFPPCKDHKGWMHTLLLCSKQSIFPQFLLLHKGGLSFSADPAFACPRESALGWAFWAAHAVLGGWQDLATGNFSPVNTCEIRHLHVVGHFGITNSSVAIWCKRDRTRSVTLSAKHFLAVSSDLSNFLADLFLCAHGREAPHLQQAFDRTIGQ